MVEDFKSLSHLSSNLGFFMVIVRWLIEYAGDSAQRYQEFMNHKVNEIVKALLKIRNGKACSSMMETIELLRSIKDMSFSEFEKIMVDVNSKIDDIMFSNDSNAKFNVVPIYSYEELNEKYGGNKTGYNGKSEWCHANGFSTYDSWTKNGT